MKNDKMFIPILLSILLFTGIGSFWIWSINTRKDVLEPTMERISGDTARTIQDSEGLDNSVNLVKNNLNTITSRVDESLKSISGLKDTNDRFDKTNQIFEQFIESH